MIRIYSTFNKKYQVLCSNIAIINTKLPQVLIFKIVIGGERFKKLVCVSEKHELQKNNKSVMKLANKHSYFSEINDISFTKDMTISKI